MSYVYCHLIKNTNIPFYYGKGTGQRAFVKGGKNSTWLSMTAMFGYDVAIIWDNITVEDAKKKEKLCILAAKICGFSLANRTAGGEPGRTLGFKMSKETLEYLSKIRKGMTPWNRGNVGISDSLRKKLSDSHKGQLPVNSIKVIDLKTGAVWPSVTQAAKAVGLSQAGLSFMLNGDRKNSTDLAYLEGKK